MPYFIVPTDLDPACQNVAPFARVATNGTREDLVGQLQAGERIVYEVDYREQREWRRREARRFSSGQYRPALWPLETRPEHYVHLSEGVEGLIAYTLNDEHGHGDRQTRIKPGKYLAKYHPDLSEVERARLASLATTGEALKICETLEEIVRVYTDGPLSCMDGRHFSRSRYLNTDRMAYHPCAVYQAPGDLRVAYLGDIDRVKARVVIWPKKRTYARIYDTGDSGMEHVLERAGYSQGSPIGAKILRLDAENSGYVMPYVDGADCCEEYSEGLWRLGSGEVDCHSQAGQVEDDSLQFVCSHCEGTFDGDPEEHTYCDRCEETRYCCEQCEEDTWEPVQTEGGRTLCEHCADREHRECQIEDCENSWHTGDYTKTELADRARRHVEDVCEDCAELYVWCANCENLTPADEPACQICGDVVRIRCDRTLDLPLAPETDPAAAGVPKPIIAANGYAPDGMLYRVDGISREWWICTDGRIYSRAWAEDAWRLTDATRDQIQANLGHDRPLIPRVPPLASVMRPSTDQAVSA